jgi:hypothetical protein
MWEGRGLATYLFGCLGGKRLGSLASERSCWAVAQQASMSLDPGGTVLDGIEDGVMFVGGGVSAAAGNGKVGRVEGTRE